MSCGFCQLPVSSGLEAWPCMRAGARLTEPYGGWGGRWGQGASTGCFVGTNQQMMASVLCLTKAQHSSWLVVLIHQSHQGHQGHQDHQDHSGHQGLAEPEWATGSIAPWCRIPGSVPAVASAMGLRPSLAWNHGYSCPQWIPFAYLNNKSGIAVPRGLGHHKASAVTGAHIPCVHWGDHAGAQHPAYLGSG